MKILEIGLKSEVVLKEKDNLIEGLKNQINSCSIENISLKEQIFSLETKLERSRNSENSILQELNPLKNEIILKDKYLKEEKMKNKNLVDL